MSTHRFITGDLIARSAVHIGSGRENNLSDALIRRDSSGRPIVPGTALAGALRALLTRLAPALGYTKCHALKEQEDKRNDTCSCQVCQLFGSLNPTDDEHCGARASKLLVFDAVLQTEQSGATLIRDKVGIERMSGVAARAAAAKFDLEVLPAGASFPLRVELRNGDESDARLLAAGLAEWEAGRSWLGGRVARGLGAFHLDNIRCSGTDMNDPAQLINFLGSDSPWEESPEDDTWLSKQIQETREDLAALPAPQGRKWAYAEFLLQAEGPFLINDSSSAGSSGFDHAPLLMQLNDWGTPVLPGSSLRGVLRSQAERIARTLTTLRAKNKAEFLAACPACDPTASRLKADEPKSLESCASLLKRLSDSEEKQRMNRTGEADDEHFCLACRLFGSTWRGSRLIVEDAPYDIHGEQETPIYKMLDFLAIDRFTGGGADGAKFDALALWKPAFRVRLFLDEPQAWELGWLALTLRDLQEGWLRVGMGAAKGFGKVKVVDGWNLKLGAIGDDNFGLPKTGSSGVYDLAEYTPETQASWLTQAENAWVNAFQQKLSTLSTSRKGHDLPDSYFDDGLCDLYEKEVSL